MLTNSLEICVALFDFTSTEPEELGFYSGDRIYILEKDEGFDDGWWKGKNALGNVGIFPSNFVEVLSNDNEASDSTTLSIELKPLTNWTVDDVIKWISKEGFEEFVDAFKEFKINGKILLSPFFDEKLLNEMGIQSKDDQLKILDKLESLKETYVFNFPSPPSFYKNIQPVPISPLRLSKELSFVSIEPLPMPLKSPSRKKRTETIKLTPMIPNDVRTLTDVLKSPDGNNWKCDYEGYLYKRGGRAHWSWKRRFFILKDLTLWYFKNSLREAKPLGLIVLPSYTILPSKECDLKAGIYTFMAQHHDARTYWFRAESLEEMKGWMNAMVQASLGITVNTKKFENFNIQPPSPPISPKLSIQTIEEKKENTESNSSPVENNSFTERTTTNDTEKLSIDTETQGNSKEAFKKTLNLLLSRPPSPYILSQLTPSTSKDSPETFRFPSPLAQYYISDPSLGDQSSNQETSNENDSLSDEKSHG